MNERVPAAGAEAWAERGEPSGAGPVAPRQAETMAVVASAADSQRALLFMNPRFPGGRQRPARRRGGAGPASPSRGYGRVAVMKSKLTVVAPFSMNTTFVIVVAGGSVRLSSVTLLSTTGGELNHGAGVVESPPPVTQ